MSMFEKVKKFVKDHPEATLYILLGLTIGGCAVAAAVQDRKEHQRVCEGLENCLDAIEKNEQKKKDWEQYEENWNLVNEFAKHLKLLPGEMFILEDPEQYRDFTDFQNVDFSIPIVSHLVYNEGVYPPEG